jgi:hypothetical protein
MQNFPRRLSSDDASRKTLEKTGFFLLASGS